MQVEKQPSGYPTDIKSPAHPEDEFPPNLQKSFDQIIKSEGYITYTVEKTLINTEGVSYLAKPYLVTIKGSTSKGKKESHIFVKSIIPSAKIETTLNLPQAYAAEAFVYNELSKVFKELQTEYGIPAQDMYKILKSYDGSNSEGIFLENVVVRGFKPPHRAYTMTLRVAELAIQEIAKFHALSFVIQAKRPEYYEKRIVSAKHPFTFNEEWDQSGVNMAIIATSHLEGEAKRKVEALIPKIAEKWKVYQDNTSLTKCCLCHGDFRLNNLLIKEDNGEVSDLFVIDYQLVWYASPINDLLYFIFMSTDQDFRNRHLEHIKNLYYATFSNFLRKFSLNSDNIYSRDEFDKDYKDRLDYGLISALTFLPFFLVADGDIPDLGQESAVELNFKVHEIFPERIRGVVDDFIRWGYL